MLHSNQKLVVCHFGQKNHLNEHNYSRRIISGKSNVNQIISGGGGEKLKSKYHSKNGVIVPPIAIYHFVVVDLNPKSIKISAINIKGKVLDKFII